MQEETNRMRPVRVAPAVFLSALSVAFVAGWFVGLAPDCLGWFGKFILYWVSMPICLVLLVIGVTKVIGASDISGIPSAKDSVSYVLSPEDLARWRSIKPGMDRHEVTAIIGQPDGPPKLINAYLLRTEFAGLPLDYDDKIVYGWGTGMVFFHPNGGPVFQVKIPEYI
jgi:hypothetical protein